MFGLSPYLLGGTAIILVASNVVTGYKAYQFGGNAAQIKCERRVDDLQSKWDKEIAKITASNKAWTAALVTIQESGNKEAADLQAEVADLNKKVEEYETSIGNDANCTIGKPDVDRLR